MAILMEGISVVVRIETIRKKFRGGWNAFKSIIPNKSLCSDNELARVGFMAPPDAGVFVGQLQEAGLVFVNSGKAIDLVVVDQLRGPTAPCDWLEFGHVSMECGEVAACRLAGSQSMEVVTPDWWTYEGSLSASHRRVLLGNINNEMKFLRTENGVDVYLDRSTGKEVFIGRTSGSWLR